MYIKFFVISNCLDFNKIEKKFNFMKWSDKVLIDLFIPVSNFVNLN